MSTRPGPPPGYRADPSPALILGLGLGLVLAALSWLGRDVDVATAAAPAPPDAIWDQAWKSGHAVGTVAATAADQAERPTDRAPLVDVDSLRDL